MTNSALFTTDQWLYKKGSTLYLILLALAGQQCHLQALRRSVTLDVHSRPPQAAMPDANLTAELRNVDVEINGFYTILSDICLTIPRATTVAIIGASGSGKSTLLKLLNGLRTPSAGQVLRDGHALADSDLRKVRFNTGYALQEIGLLPHLSVRDNIALPMKLAGWQAQDIDARIDELIGLMQLKRDAIDRYPTQMSGGQQQRAGLCRALALKPDLLPLDEALFWPGRHPQGRKRALSGHAGQSDQRVAWLRNDLNGGDPRFVDQLVVTACKLRCDNNARPRRGFERST